MSSPKRTRKDGSADGEESQTSPPPKRARHEEDEKPDRDTSNENEETNPNTTSAGTSSAEKGKEKALELRPFYKGGTNCRGVDLLFDPARSARHARVPSKTPIFYCEITQTSRLYMLTSGFDRFNWPMNWEVDYKSLVIYVKGFRVTEKTAACTVYFGPESKYNNGYMMRLPDGSPLKELDADAIAFCDCFSMLSNLAPNHPLLSNVSLVVLASDSSYLINALLEPGEATYKHSLIGPRNVKTL